MTEAQERLVTALIITLSLAWFSTSVLTQEINLNFGRETPQTLFKGIDLV